MASLSPWILTHLFHLGDKREPGVPFSVKLSFYIGAVVFLGTVVWKVVTTSETPPKNLEKIQNARESKSTLNKVTEIFWLIKAMSTTIKQLAVV